MRRAVRMEGAEKQGRRADVRTHLGASWFWTELDGVWGGNTL